MKIGDLVKSHHIPRQWACLWLVVYKNSNDIYIKRIRGGEEMWASSDSFEVIS